MDTAQEGGCEMADASILITGSQIISALQTRSHMHREFGEGDHQGSENSSQIVRTMEVDLLQQNRDSKGRR